MTKYLSLASLVCMLVLTVAHGDELPKEVVVLVEKAGKLVGDKKFTEAAAALNEAAKLAPKNDFVRGKASETCWRAGLFAEGLEHAKAALAINDKIGAYHMLAGANAASLGELTVARKYIRTVLEGDSTFNEVKPAAQEVAAGLVSRTYTITWEMDPKKGVAEGGAFRIALPKAELPYQTFSYKIDGVKSHKVVKDDANDTLVVVPQGKESFKLTMEIKSEPYSYKDQFAKRKVAPLPAAAKAFLGTHEYIIPDNPAIKAVTKSLKGKDEIETVNNITAWMKQNIEYKPTGKRIDTIDFKTADEILERKSAECLGYSVLFTAMCRSAGVPARTLWSLYFKPDGRDVASHNFVEVYVSGIGWVPVDPQIPASFGNLPNTHIRMYMSMRKTSKSNESLPQLNLVYMTGENMKFAYKSGKLTDLEK